MFPRHLRPPRLVTNYTSLQPGVNVHAPVYTLHERNTHNLFAIHLEDLETEDVPTKTCMAVFMKRGDAIDYGKLLEGHKQSLGEWPSFANKTPAIDLKTDDRKPVRGTLQDLYVAEWTQEEVQDMGAHIMSNILVFHEVQTLEKGKLTTIHVSLTTIDLTEDYVRSRFQDIFDQAETDEEPI